MKTLMLVVAMVLGMAACSSEGVEDGADAKRLVTARDVATGYCEMLARCGTEWPTCADDILASDLLDISSLPQEKLFACVDEYQDLQCGENLTQFCVGALATE